MKIYKSGILAGFLLAILVQISTGDNIMGKVKTIYDVNGRPVNQSEDAKGNHSVRDSVTLTAGSAIVTINSSTANGAQDISFISARTYSGMAWTVDTSANLQIYRVFPLSGTQFKIKSYDSTGAFDDTDVSTVYYKLEGE